MNESAIKFVFDIYELAKLDGMTHDEIIRFFYNWSFYFDVDGDSFDEAKSRLNAANYGIGYPIEHFRHCISCNAFMPNYIPDYRDCRKFGGSQNCDECIANNPLGKLLENL